MPDIPTNPEASDNVPVTRPLTITVDRASSVPVVTVTGEIDLETSADLGAALDEVVRAGSVEIDLSSVDYMDSTGLRTLLVAKEEAQRQGRELRVTATSNIVARLIEITGVEDLLE